MARVRSRATTDIWPGFVDALAALLVVIIFLLVVFVLAQIFLAQALSGRDAALERLTTQVNELGQLLSLERESNANLRLNVAQLSASLQVANEGRDELVLRFAEARDRAQELTAQFATLQSRAETAEARVADLASVSVAEVLEFTAAFFVFFEISKFPNFENCWR